MNRIVINGQTITTNGNISIINGQVYVDGKVTDVGKIGSELKIVVVEGIINTLESDASVTCTNVSGDVSAGGSVSCNNVDGSINAGGSVKANVVKGSINAGGSVRAN